MKFRKKKRVLSRMVGAAMAAGMILQSVGSCIVYASEEEQSAKQAAGLSEEAKETESAADAVPVLPDSANEEEAAGDREETESAIRSTEALPDGRIPEEETEDDANRETHPDSSEAEPAGSSEAEEESFFEADMTEAVWEEWNREESGGAQSDPEETGEELHGEETGTALQKETDEMLTEALEGEGRIPLYGDIWAEGDGIACEEYPGLPVSLYSLEERSAAQISASALVSQMLSFLGAGYSQINRLGPDSYDCSGLVFTSFRALGITDNVPLTTAGWNELCQTMNVGDIVAFSGTAGTLEYQLTARDTEISANQEAFSVPGTIMVFIEPGESSGHVAVSLGCIPRQDQGLDPNSNGIGIVNATEAYLRNLLKEQYGISESLLSGSNRFSGNPNIWMDANHLGTDVNLGNGAYSGAYNPVFRVDALNTQFGVSVNNLLSGKSGTTVRYVLRPAVKKREGIMSFHKYGLHTGEDGIGNAEYAVYRDQECTDRICEFVTDQDGNASVSLEEGTYYCRETKAPNGYRLIEDKVWTLEVLADAAAQTRLEQEEWRSGRVTVTKKDEDTGTLLNGAVFELEEWSCAAKDFAAVGTLESREDGIYEAASYQVRSTKQIISDGKLYYTNDNAGTFRLTEIGSPENYTGSWSQVLQITQEEEAFSFTAYNKRENGELKLQKKDENGGALSGAVFGVYGSHEEAQAASDQEKGNPAALMVTDENGFASASVAVGSYYIKELKAPEGYKLEPSVYGPFSVNSNSEENPVYEVINYPGDGELFLYKKGRKEDQTTNGLPGAVFGVYRSGEAAAAGTYENRETAACVWTTDQEGYAGGRLPAGQYWVKEIRAPRGYLLDDTVYGGNDGYQVKGTAAPVEIAVRENIPVQGKIVIHKYGADGKEERVPLSDALFEVYRSKADAAAGMNPVEAIRTDESGTAETSLMEAGYYWIKETKAPEGYQLDETIYGGETGFQVGWTAAVREIEVKDNIPTPGRLTLYKEGRNEAGQLKPLSGAVFGIYATRAQAKEGTEDNAEESLLLRTGEDGYAVSGLLPRGEYYLKELKAPEGYELSETIYGPLQVGGTNTLVQADIEENVPKKGWLRMEKADALTGHLLDGAIYSVYTDEQCTKKAGEAVITDGKGQIELDYGVYWVRETGIPFGYQQDQKIYGPFTVGGTSGDAEIPQIAEEEQRIEICLDKQDAETGAEAQGDAVLQGAVFELRAAEDIVHPDQETGTIYRKGETVAFLTTDQEGHASVQKDKNGEWLHCGAYELIEVKAPAGYLPDQTVYSIDAGYDVTKVTDDYAVHYAGIIPDQVIRQPVVLHKITDEHTAPAVELSGIGFSFYLISDVCAQNGVTQYRDLPFNSRGVDVDKLNLDGLSCVIGENGETELFTDMHGKLRTVPLAYGEYLVVETTCNRYYDAGAPFTVTVPTVQGRDENGTETDLHEVTEMPKYPLEVPVINWPASAYLQVEKLDSETGTLIRQAKVPFWILDGDGNRIVQYAWDGKQEVETDTFWTNDEGYLRTCQPLDTGEYTLVEVSAPAGYVKGEPIHVVIESQKAYYTENGKQYPCRLGYTAAGDAVAAVTVKNTPITVEISKTDIVSGEEIQGAALAIYTITESGEKGEIAYVKDAAGNDVPAAWVTDGTKHQMKRIPAGKYLLEETRIPDGQGYVSAESILFEVLETGEIQRVEMKDDYTKTEISKTDLVTGEEVIGAELQILNEKGEVIAEWVTDGRPHRIDRLPVGSYRLVETLAPVEQGYVRAQEVEFSILDTAKLQRVEMKDDFTKILISKTDITTGEELAGARLQIRDPEGQVIEEWVTEGTPHRIDYLPAADGYTLTELCAPEGYLSAESMTFSVLETGEIQTIVMKDDYTKTEIVKTDLATGKEIKGAVLQIFDGNGGKAAEWITDGTPHRIDRLPAGEYTLVETLPPVSQGYIRSESVPFTVLETGAVQRVEMKDDFTKVMISKTDITTGEELVGARLQIRDPEGQVISEWITDGTPHRIDYLPAADGYTLMELRAPEGYLCAEAVTFDVLETGTLQTVEMKDDYTRTEISKQDITTGKELPGAVLQLCNQEGRIIEEWVSEETPHRIDRLPAGDYILREVTAPEGYETAEEIRFTVLAAGELQRVIMKDVPKQGRIVTPTESASETEPSEEETSAPVILGIEDDSSLCAAVLLAAGMALLAIAAGNLVRRRKNR